MNREDFYNADLGARIADDEDDGGGTRTPLHTTEAACDAVHDVVQAHGRIIELPGGFLADLADPRGAAAYLLSRGTRYRSPIERLTVMVKHAVRQVRETEQVDASDGAALEALAGAVHDLDRVLVREDRQATIALLELEMWIEKIGQRFDIKAFLRQNGSDAAAVVGLLAIAALLKGVDLDRSDARLAHLVRSGCPMPTALAHKIAGLPYHGFRAFAGGLNALLAGPDAADEGVPGASVF